MGKLHRHKSHSPFPSAYKIISDFEIDLTPTKIWSPSRELLDACKVRDHKCAGCGQEEEIDYDWTLAVLLDADGNSQHHWYCKLCFKVTENKDPYFYKGSSLDFAEESPFKKNK